MGVVEAVSAFYGGPSKENEVGPTQNYSFLDIIREALDIVGIFYLIGIGY